MTELFASQAFGRYSLVGRIAQGGMAEIFRARHDGPAGFSRDLVIKRILPEFVRNTEFVEMFLDEAKLVAQLSHPNIVQIHDFGEVAGSYFMAMELVAGPNLGGVVKAATEQDHPVPLRIAAKICAGVAEGLHYAHHLTGADGQPLHIVHRDISTSNILVTHEGVPKILDFGIAKAATHSHKTATGLIKGKLGYMPPEQVRSQSLDGRTDIYSLGVVLYRLVTLRMPYRADSEFELMQAICSGQHAAAGSLRSDVPRELDQIIGKAMELEPGSRFQTGRDLVAALDRFGQSQGEPVNAFDVAEYIHQLAVNASEPLDELGVPGSSKLSAPPESLGGAGTQPTMQLLERVESTAAAPIGQPVLTAVGPAPDEGGVSSGRRLALAALVVACIGAGVGATVWLATATDAEPTALRSEAVLADPPPTPVAAPPDTLAPGLEPAAPTLKTEPARVAEAQPSESEAAVEAKALARKKRRGRRRKASRPGNTAEAAPVTLPTAAADTTPGTVAVLVKPWGNVFVDGKASGITPISPLRLAPGKHRVRVVQPDTGRSVEKMIDVVAGSSETLRFDLSR